MEGVLAWLPALVILIGMPLLALVAVKHVLIPTLRETYSQEAAMNAEYSAAQETPVVLARIPLKIANTTFRSVGLVGSDASFTAKIDQNKAMLTSVALSDLKGKTASDLDKPGALDRLRVKMTADFNRVLGEPVVKEVYIAVAPSP